jgi:DTW domain-containing protein YfiP
MKDIKKIPSKESLFVQNRKGGSVPLSQVKGIVLLDGTWKQSKTLWWRNPWLLKLSRAFLIPENFSKYGEIRKQPRKQCLSTLEAGIETLASLGENQAITDSLASLMESHLERCKNREVTLP